VQQKAQTDHSNVGLVGVCKLLASPVQGCGFV
jgi:hypothetical protein